MPLSHGCRSGEVWFANLMPSIRLSREMAPRCLVTRGQSVQITHVTLIPGRHTDWLCPYFQENHFPLVWALSRERLCAELNKRRLVPVPPVPPLYRGGAGWELRGRGLTGHGAVWGFSLSLCSLPLLSKLYPLFHSGKEEGRRKGKRKEKGEKFYSQRKFRNT